MSLSPLSLAAVVLGFLATLEIGGMGLLSPLEGRVLDTLVKAHASGLEPDRDIVIVDIDEASLAKMSEIAGKFPWPRSVHADLVRGIEAQRPRAIVVRPAVQRGGFLQPRRRPRLQRRAEEPDERLFPDPAPG